MTESGRPGRSRRASRPATKKATKKKSPWHFVALDPDDVEGSYAAIMKMVQEAGSPKPSRKKSTKKRGWK